MYHLCALLFLLVSLVVLYIEDSEIKWFIMKLNFFFLSLTALIFTMWYKRIPLPKKMSLLYEWLLPLLVRHKSIDSGRYNQVFLEVLKRRVRIYPVGTSNEKMYISYICQNLNVQSLATFCLLQVWDKVVIISATFVYVRY